MRNQLTLGSARTSQLAVVCSPYQLHLCTYQDQVEDQAARQAQRCCWLDVCPHKAPSRAVLSHGTPPHICATSTQTGGRRSERVVSWPQALHHPYLLLMPVRADVVGQHVAVGRRPSQPPRWASRLKRWTWIYDSSPSRSRCSEGCTKAMYRRK
jgi:hypothetical protein